MALRGNITLTVAGGAAVIVGAIPLHQSDSQESSAAKPTTPRDAPCWTAPGAHSIASSGHRHATAEHSWGSPGD